MNPSFFPTYFIIFMVIFLALNEARKNRLLKIIRDKKKKRGTAPMNEVINAYIGKDCVIYLSNSSSVITGNLISLNDNWITVKTKDGNEILNIDYIVRLKEHPVNKKGKKKEIIF